MVSYWLLGARWVLTLILAHSAYAKLKDRKQSVARIAEYGILPRAVLTSFAAALPIGELGLAIAMAVGLLPPVAGGLVALLFLTFAGAVSWNLSRGRTFDCGCGTSSRQISWRLVLLDLGLAAVGAAIAAGPSNALALMTGPWFTRAHPSAIDALPVPLAVLAAAVGLKVVMSEVPFTYGPLGGLARWTGRWSTTVSVEETKA